MPPKVLDVTKPINHKTNKITMIVSNINFLPPCKLCFCKQLLPSLFQFLCQTRKTLINQQVKIILPFTRQ